MSKPKITVLMSVYNGEKYLRQAIDSILSQTFKDFEFLIINDNSTDKTAKILQRYNDSRIKTINNKKNMGLTKSLNIGIRKAQGKYIARMDADDISLSNRLHKQFQFLENHKNIGVVGSSVYLINQSGGKIEKQSIPQKHFLIKWNYFTGSSMSHPTIMIRAKVLKVNLYNENFISAQDAELFSRLLFDKNIKFANLDNCLLKYRKHSNSVTKKRPIGQEEKSVEIRIKNIERYINLSNKEKEIIRAIKIKNKLTIKNILNERKIYKRLFHTYRKKDELDKEQAKKIGSCLFKKTRELIKKYLREKFPHIYRIYYNKHKKLKLFKKNTRNTAQ